ncbi:MAG: hypothetical protein HPY74_08460 [Firmicutes bacterium]|nr:hypothetical protein [Bacillota bacterium]
MINIESSDKGIENAKVEGLLVHLFKKLMPGDDDGNDSLFQYKMWSAFDGMIISTVTDLENVYMGNDLVIEGVKGNKVNIHQVYEEQHLCLYGQYVENNEIIQQGYSIKNGSSDIIMPYIALTEVKLNDTYIGLKGLDYCQKKIEEILEKGCLNQIPEHKTFYCFRIYRSLGYGDFIIIFRSHSYDGIFQGIERFHREVSKLHENFINSTSSIAGISQKHMLYINNTQWVKDIQSKMSWTYNFQIGDTFQHNRDTSVLFNNLNAILLAIKSRLPGTLYLPLQNLLYKCEQLSQSAFGITLFHELPNIIATLFLTLMESMGCKIDVNSLMNEHIPENILANLRNDTGTQTNIDSLMLAIQLLSEFITDRIQAGRFLSEVPLTNLKFKESISKVIIAYSSLITTVMKEIQQCLRKLNGTLTKTSQAESELVVFLTLGISNQINSFLFFPDSSLNPPRRLISVNCDNMSLFHINYAVCLILHEIAHYIRPLDRKKRNEYFLKMVCGQVTQKVISFMFGNTNAVSDECMQLFSIIVEHIENTLYEIIWVSLTEDEKNLIFMEFKDRLYTFITNSLISIDYVGYISKNNGFQPVFSENKQLCIWKSMMDNLFENIANKLKQQLTSEQNGECEEAARYLASCWLHEDTVENRNCFTKEFIRILDSGEMKEIITEIADRTKDFFSEVIADAYMCSLLGLSRDEYLNLVFDFFRFSYGIQLKDFFKNSDSFNIHDAITIQARVWMILTGFNCRLDTDITCSSWQMVQKQNIKEKEIAESTYKKVKCFIKEIRGEYLFKYMDEVFDFCNNELLSGKCYEIWKLRENYRNFCSSDSNDKISRQVQFIQYYWLKGLNQMINDQNKQKGVIYEYC